MKEVKTVYSGTSLSTLLTVVFVTLKLCNVINWSWWWVLSPLWIPVAIIIAVLVILVIAIGIAACFKKE